VIKNKLVIPKNIDGIYFNNQFRFFMSHVYHKIVRKCLMITHDMLK